ncbi:formyltransferase family protein [Sphingobacterium sp. BIGb0165]|uniref:formyltransferase family protein n=1 Tax=Sphingobacterium sp. BIGb0165 TaxID=2940615 RepID=UPI0021673CA3|nr:formyltransferase family protein [Sphingobacterium sp. BIGb0165]MCS4226917.1 methionyl-tRNA formyltransferase [Sphingobacterium sp. BIGb0165]
MRILLVVDETCFYQPDFVADLLKFKREEIIGCALVVKILPKNNITSYMIRNYKYLTLKEMYKLLKKRIVFFVKNTINQDIPHHFYSVKSVLKHFNIPYFQVKYNINKREYINKIKALKPDVIISSNSLYFGYEILSIPRFCLNRHSGLLPSYGGVWPIFQALRNDECEVGVSVHLMNTQIDRGLVLAQYRVAIREEDTVDALYQKCFTNSAQVCIDALIKIENGTIADCSKETPSYYSFPTQQHWREFRERRKKFI